LPVKRFYLTDGFFSRTAFFRVALKRTAEKIAKNRERDWEKLKRQEQSRQRNSPRKETNGVREDVFQEKRSREKKRRQWRRIKRTPRKASAFVFQT